MKENWTYKKLGEVATFVNGYPFKPDDWEETGMPIIRIQNLNNPDAAFNFYNGLIDSRYIVNNGDVLISWSGTLGVYEWTKEEKALLNQHIFKVVFDKTPINKGFFKYAVSSRINEMKSKVHGITMQHITKGEFDKTIIPVPSIETQSCIVSELDLLQSIIDKQQAQLKELDKLAQAVFYDMFGDPVENEKGWKVMKLGELCDVYRGGSPRPIEQYLGGTIPWIKIGDATKGDDIYLHQTKEHIIEEGLNKTRFIHSGSLIFANCGVSLGFARIITFNGCIHDGWLAFDNISNEIEKVFLLKSLNFCTQYFRSIAPDGTQPNLNTSIMKSFKQIVPPLTIQKNYIAKIESIEKQKAAINQSIEETQKLFNYTMDKYFG